MKTILLSGLNEQESDEMRQAFAHAARLRQHLSKVLQSKVDASNKTVRSKDAYGIANWAYLQADAVGYERAMQEIMSLLEPAVEERRATIQGTHPEAIKRSRGRPRKNI